ncbi:MAG TPA: GNAT family N-acetyltransferase [Caldilineaceae bacterium]|nr:GNAT family N-acetyltransferase [Caldilineaceae bacterium]
METALEQAIKVQTATEADLPRLVQIIHAAYAEYAGRLDPPSGAHQEDVTSLAAKLRRGGGALAWIDGVAAGSVLYEGRGDSLYLGRLAVIPAYRGYGIGRRLVAHVEEQARVGGYRAVTLGVRIALPQNLLFYRRLGYVVTQSGCHPGYREPTYYTMEKAITPEWSGAA